MDFKKFVYSLTAKLIITIGAMMIIGSTIFLFFLVRQREREIIDNSIRQGIDFTELVKKSTDYGMLTFHRPMIQHTVEDIGNTKGVILIRIFNSKGRIAYSSKTDDIGKVLDEESLGPPKNAVSWSLKKSLEGDRILIISLPIFNKPACYTSACHAHPQEQKVLGVVESHLSFQYLDTRIKRNKIILTTYVFVILFISAIVLWIILWNLISKPIRILRRGMKRVAAGELDYAVNIDTKDEIGELAKVFNTMTSELSKAKRELVDWGQTLEKKVEEKAEEIKKTHAQLIHSAKLASLGKMAAGVAHELNSPITGIITFGHLLLKRFSEGSQESDDIKVIIDQADRCSNIIKGLLRFSRADTADKEPVDVNDILKSSLNLISRKADFFNISIIMDLDKSLPFVKANSSQLQQVFLNMIINAGDAMNGKGKGNLFVCTRKVIENDKPFVEVEFTDTGCGISEENMPKIFEPFFTQKSGGKGTGLGLSISHGIIQEHGGKILVKSKIAEGTSFFVRLPFDEQSKT